MHIKQLQVKNFRALEDVDVDFDNKVSVIVGPNAIGKTTILESIRLVKALLSPRTQNEATQALFALGASSPHVPQLLNVQALLRNSEKIGSIRITYQMTEEECIWYEQSIDSVARNVVQGQRGQAFANQAAMLTYLGSPQGINEITQITTQLKTILDELKNNSRKGVVKLTIDPATGLNATEGAILATVIAAIDQHHQPNISSFSYFPADRALPQGEQPIQIGGVDAQQQLESHNSQPQLKYARLKSIIFNAMLMQEAGSNIQEDFEQIFSGILKGKKLVGSAVNTSGLVSIRVGDIESGRDFDIDAMSSGEKGLILTSLLIKRSLANGGVVLLDEPELHLNPAVCKELLNFFIKSYVVPKDLQLIVCSHSPEILSNALERDDCSLYHLESEKLLTKVRVQDHDVISEALRRLGTSESDGLLYKGTIFVEGPDDVALLEAGFGELLRRFKPKDLGGRPEIEKQISLLQDAEKKGQKQSLRAFIFDRDDAPTNLQSSENVRILQWSKRCFENYLIDIDILADLLMNEEYVTKKLTSVGEVQKVLKELATNQLDEIAIRTVYQSKAYASPGMRKEDVRDLSLEAATEALYKRIKIVRDQLESIEEEKWKVQFKEDCQKYKSRLEETWDSKWLAECDGKRLLSDLHNKVQPRSGGLRKFKVKIMQEMRLKSNENWKTLKAMLEETLKPTPKR